MIALICGILGLIVGSFLNVVILRHDEKGLGGRSVCMSCQRTLTWIDLIPVFSWIVLLGKCRTCKSPISIQYPLVEIATAAIFALIGTAFFHNHPGLEFVLSWRVLILILYFTSAALLIAITVYDFYHMIIPDEWVFLFAGVALLGSLISHEPSTSALMIILGGPIAAFPLYMLWFVSGGKWMGLGDPKLALGMGWLLGAYLGLIAVFFAFVIGAVVSVCVLIPVSRLQKGGEQITIKSEVPFGPFLVVSTLFIWLMTMYGIPLPLFS